MQKLEVIHLVTTYDGDGDSDDDSNTDKVTIKVAEEAIQYLTQQVPLVELSTTMIIQSLLLCYEVTYNEIRSLLDTSIDSGICSDGDGSMNDDRDSNDSNSGSNHQNRSLRITISNDLELLREQINKVIILMQTSNYDVAVGSSADDDNAIGDRAIGDRAIGDRAIGDRAVGDRAVGEGERVLDDDQQSIHTGISIFMMIDIVIGLFEKLEIMLCKMKLLRTVFLDTYIDKESNIIITSNNSNSSNVNDDSMNSKDDNFKIQSKNLQNLLLTLAYKENYVLQNDNEVQHIYGFLRSLHQFNSKTHDWYSIDGRDLGMAHKKQYICKYNFPQKQLNINDEEDSNDDVDDDSIRFRQPLYTDMVNTLSSSSKLKTSSSSTSSSLFSNVDNITYDTNPADNFQMNTLIDKRMVQIVFLIPE